MYSFIEFIFVEFVKNGIIQECFKRIFDEYMSCDNYIDESFNKDLGVDVFFFLKGRRGVSVRKLLLQKKSEQKKSKKRKVDLIVVVKVRVEFDNFRRKFVNKDLLMKEVR